jgi:dTDP-4-dehydrorhamnose reductase
MVKQSNWDYVSRKKDNIDLNKTITWSQLLMPYDTIINCIAHTNTYDNTKDLHWEVNYSGVSKLVDYCNLHNKKLVHISTDYVYANSNNEATESDIPIHCKNWYSYTKLLADAYIELKCKDYLICRESHKPYPFTYEYAWSDQYSNGDYTPVIADLIIRLIKKDAKNLYNIGTNKKTWYELTKDEFNTKIGYRKSDAPENITMNVEKMKNFLNDNI